MSQRTTRSKEEVAGIIKSILVAEKKSSTIGVPIVQLEDEYRSQDGMRIPYRALGYACLMDFLESLQRSGEIVIGKRGSMHVVYLCVDEKIAHVSALVSGQKDSSKRCSRGGKRFTTRSYPRVLYQPPRLDSKTLADVLKLIKTAANGIHASRIIEYLHDRNNFNVDEDQLMRQLRDVSHEVSIVNSTIFPIMRKKVSPRNSPQKNYNSTNGFAGEKRSSPAYRPAGSSDGEEDNETFEFVTKSDNTQLPMSNNANLIYEETQAAPSNFEENADAARRENTNPRVDDDDDDIGFLVNKRTRFRLEKLIQKHRNGIWCAELPEFYRQEYSIPLNYEDLGFGNVSDFAAHLPEIFHCVRLQENGDFKLFDAKSPKPETRQNPRPEHLSLAALHSIYERFNEDVDPVPVLLSPTTSRRLVPEGVMTIGETVAQICVTELFNDNTPHVDVIVVDTVTPTFFWIQLLRKLQKFDRFMRDLHVFYSENASKYVMPIVLLERGLNCACIFDKKWHRGVIKTVKPNSTVTVLFYDYGTVMTYPPEDIHFLHRSFSNLPAQAIPCGLYNVKPIDTEKWPYSVCQLFAEKVLDVPMVAMMGSIDADNNSMLIALTNTSGAVDFHISDWMISSGFAIYGKMVCIRPPNYPFRHYLECKHGKITRKEKQTPNPNRIVSYDENTTSSQALLPMASKTFENSSFYETLLKLRRKSGKNALDMSSNSSSRESIAQQEKSQFFTAKTSQPVAKTITNRVTQENASKKPIVIQNGEKSSAQSKNYGTTLLTKLCVSHAEKMAALNVGSSESDLNETKSSNDASSSSGGVNLLSDCKNINSERNRVHRIQENPEISPVPKRFAKLAEIAATNGFKPIIPSTKSNETFSDEQIAEKPPVDTPLHLRPEIPGRRNCNSEFGAIYSELGGHGLMEPIDWNLLRNGEKSADNSNDALLENLLPPNSSTPLEKHAKSKLSSAFDDFQKPILQTSFPYTQFDNRSDASIEFTSKTRGKQTHSEKHSSAKINQETEITRKSSYQKMENEEEKALASCRDLQNTQEKYSIKRYLELAIAEEKASKPRAWNVPKTDKNLLKDYPEKSNSRECIKQAEAHKKIVHSEGKSPASRHRDSSKSQAKYSGKSNQEMENLEGKSSASRHRDSSKSQAKYSGKSDQEMENSEGKSSAPRHRETSKSQTKHSEKSSQMTSDFEKTTSKPEHKVFSTISPPVSQNPASISKLASKKIGFLNLVRGRKEIKEDLPEFGHFHSNFGGHGRLETIAWDELRNPEILEKIEAPKKVLLKNKKRAPVKRREPVGKGFFNIINSVLPPPNQRDSLYVPEGNLMRQTELSPNLRNILKNINEDVQDKQLRLFIPDDVAELLENDDSTSISSSSSSSEANKCTVKYRNLCKPNASLGSRSSSDTIPDSTESDSSRAANDSHRDFDSTNDASGIMSGNASTSGEKLIKSTDTSATASQPSPAAAFGDFKQITRNDNASESNADEKKSRSPKAEKIGRDNVKKRVDLDAEAPLIQFDFDSTNDASRIMSGNASKSEEKPLKSTDTSATDSQPSPAAAFGDFKQITRNDNASESNADEKKSRSPKAEKIGRHNVRKRVNFDAESPLIQFDFDSTNDASGIMSGNASKSGEKLFKSTDTSATDSQPSPAAAFGDFKQITRNDNASESNADEEKSRSPKAEKIGRDNVKKRVDFDAEAPLIQFDFDSTNDASGIKSGNASKSGEKLSKSTDTSATDSQASPEAAFGDFKQMARNDKASESSADGEKSKSPKAEKIGRDNVKKRVNFGAESPLIQHLKSSGTSPENRVPKSADFSEDKRDTNADFLSQLTEGEEKSTTKRIETIGIENVENRVDSFAKRNSPRRFLSFDDSRASNSENGPADDTNLTKERKIVKTVTDGSEKFPDPEKNKTPNAWIQSSSLKLTDSIFTKFLKFFDSRNDFADDSDLDSDDLSSAEESIENVSTQLEESTNDNHSPKLESFANEINESFDATSRKSLDSNDDQFSLHSDFSSEKIEAVVLKNELQVSKERNHRDSKELVKCEHSRKNEKSISLPKNAELAKEEEKMNVFKNQAKMDFSSEKIENELQVSKKNDHRDSEESVNCEDSGKVEKSICLPKNAEVAKEDDVMYYDDTCVPSDDEEWDFSPGGLLPRNIDNGYQLMDRNAYKKIDAPSELKKTVIWEESESDDDRADDLSKNQQKNASSNVFVDSTHKNEKSDEDSILTNESLENKPNFTHKNENTDSEKDSISTNESFENDPNFTHRKGKIDSEKDSSSTNESFESKPNFTRRKEKTDSDKDSISTNESFENDPNWANNTRTSTDCKQTSHSILSEVQKLNISATANAFAQINSSSSSSSSSSSKNESYTKSLMRAFKHYL